MERDAGAGRAAEVDVELRRVSTALERACEQKVAASHEVVVLEAEAESEAHVGCTRAGCASGASAELRAARQHSQREKDVQQAQEHLCLREGEHHEHQLIRRQRRERTLEEMQEFEASLGAVRRKGRASVNESLREFRAVCVVTVPPLNSWHGLWSSMSAALLMADDEPPPHTYPMTP